MAVSQLGISAGWVLHFVSTIIISLLLNEILTAAMQWWHKIPIMGCKGIIILHLPFSVPPSVCLELKSLQNLCFQNSFINKMHTNILTFVLKFFLFYYTNKMYTNMFGFQTCKLFIKVSLFCQINASFVEIIIFVVMCYWIHTCRGMLWCRIVTAVSMAACEAFTSLQAT